MSRRNLYWLLGIAAVSFFGIAVSYATPTREKDRDYELVRLMVDVLHEVRSKYVVEVSPERERKLVEDMINGGLERLDPHSQYINPHDYKQFDKQSEGKFGGIGIQVGFDRQNRGQLSVISPMPGTPAYEAGVLAGDVILKIDGKATETMRMGEAIDMIQGEPGTKIVLSLAREGKKEPVDVTITRALIKVPSVLGDKRKKDDPKSWDFFIDAKERIGYVRLTSFSKNSTAELKSAIEQLEKDGVRAVVLDLRNNPGGLLKAAVEISDLFLDEGLIVSTKGRNYKDEVYRAKAEGTLLNGPNGKVPMAVLINKYSASASEIVSAALQDHKRAVIVGERSYGKGSVQNVLLMENETSALKLTTASYWRPSGKNIHRFPDKKDFESAKIDPDEWGVKPDAGMEVPMKDADRVEWMTWRSDRDVVRAKPKAAQKDKDGKPKPPYVDRVLQKAVDQLKKELADKPAAPVQRDA
jgi:carboxyl-terminal processing protease